MSFTRATLVRTRRDLRRHGILAGATLALLTAGCGGGGGGSGVPAGSVATVGGTPIEKTAFDHWLAIAANQQAPVGGAAQPVLPDPPAYRRCVGALGEQRVPKSGRRPSPAALRSECHRRYEALKAPVMAFLVRSQWLLREARSRGLAATPAAVRKELATDIKESYPKRADFQRFVRASGITTQDLQFRAKVNVLRQALLRAVQGRVNVTRAEVADYYAANRERSFTRPERRRLAIVVAKTRARAQQARKAIASGTGWRKVAKRYSIAPRALTQVSRPADGPQGQQPPAYIRSVFAARQRELQGPVKTPYGYLVFRVIDTKAATRVPLARVRGWIGRLLRAKQRRAAIAHFFRDLQKKYQGRTQCATEFAIADFCANAPKRTNRAA